MFNGVFRGKKVLVTGNTGFKGSWLTAWLLMCGAEVYGYSIDVPTEPAMFDVLGLRERIHHRFGDIRDRKMFRDYLREVRPDFIFHLAAQAIVSASYAEPFDTVTTNVVGTASVLDAVRSADWNLTVVMITSDKAYDNVEWIWGYRENDALGGKDVYSGSKGAAECVIKSYWHSFISRMDNVKLGVGEEAQNDTAPHIYNSGLVTVGEKSVIPGGVCVGKNSVVFGITSAQDYPDGCLASGKTLIKAGDEQ